MSDKYVWGEITPPKNMIQQLIYDLFMEVGILNPPPEKGKHHMKTGSGSSVYRLLTCAGYTGFQSDPEWHPEDGVEIKVPKWATSLAAKIQSTSHTAHDAGYRKGMDKGYADGTDQLQRVFNGELSFNQLEEQKPAANLNRCLGYSWDGKKYEKQY